MAGVAASAIHSYKSGNRYPFYGVLINYLTDYPVFSSIKMKIFFINSKFTVFFKYSLNFSVKSYII